MINYVFAYSGGNGVAADEAERNAQMAKWGQWFGELGSAVVDGGAATGTGTAKTVGPGGSVSDGGSRGLTGVLALMVPKTAPAQCQSQRHQDDSDGYVDPEDPMP